MFSVHLQIHQQTHPLPVDHLEDILNTSNQEELNRFAFLNKLGDFEDRRPDAIEV